MLALGVGLIVAHFLLVRYANKKVHQMKNLSSVRQSVLGALVGIASGVVITIFTEIYNAVCMMTTQWENHKYESERENSYLVKTFVFNFFVSYLLLFYYTFASATITEGDMTKKFNTLGTTFVAQVLTKSVVALLKLHVVPLIMFRRHSRALREKWRPHRANLKAEYVD